MSCSSGNVVDEVDPILTSPDAVSLNFAVFTPMGLIISRFTTSGANAASDWYFGNPCCRFSTTSSGTRSWEGSLPALRVVASVFMMRSWSTCLKLSASVLDTDSLHVQEGMIAGDKSSMITHGLWSCSGVSGSINLLLNATLDGCAVFALELCWMSSFEPLWALVMTGTPGWVLDDSYVRVSVDSSTFE